MIYHFIGIKGSGMSSLATIMHELGYNVQGSDVNKYFFTQIGLEKNNIKILPFNKDNINNNMIIVRGTTFNENNNEEVKKSIELNLEMYTYNEMVGKLTNKFKTICVCGCHGKTTTSGLLSHVLNNTIKTNYLIGDGTGYANKNNEYFVLESCEYQRHFLSYNPYYTIITNIDLDHVDYFKDINDVIDAYQEFANKTKKLVLACGDNNNVRKLKLNKKIIYYGINDNNNNDIQAININYKDSGISFDVIIDNKKYGTFDLPIYGEHNLLNTLAVIGLCYYENINIDEITKYLKTFKGTKRRFNITNVKNSIIIDDYTHHPNEVKATINAVKQKYKNKKIILIFEPHTYTRTIEFKDEFIKIFKDVNEVYIMDIHGARERKEDYNNITSDIIINELNNGHHININESNKLLKYKDSVYLFMSPNDISTLEEDLKNLLLHN